MSTVSSSDSASANAAQADTIRRTREEASKTESDLVKKHQKEIRRLNEDHYAEVENLKKSHNDQIEDLRKLSHDSVTERDHKYNQDVEEMRGLYKKQLQGQADESARKEELLRSTRDGDDKLKNNNTDSKFKTLEEEYQKSTRANEQQSNANAQTSREAQQAAIGENREKIERRYAQENKLIDENRRKEVGDLQKTFNDYRQVRDTQMRDLDQKALRDKQKDSEDLLRAVAKERVESSDNSEQLRDGFKDGLVKTRERFEKAYGMDKNSQEVARQQFKASISDRIDSEVNRLKREKAEEAEDRVRTETKLRQTGSREIADYADSYQKNIDNYREQRDAAVEGSNDRFHKGIEKVKKESSDQAVEQNRAYRQDADLQNRIHKNAIDNLKGDYETHAEQVLTQTDRRIKTISESAAEEKARMVAAEAENHSATQRSRQDDMVNLRTNLENDKMATVQQLQERLQKQELAHSEKLAAVVTKYEKQIQLMKDQSVSDKRHTDESFKRAVDELQRGHKTNMDALEAQNREKIRQLELAHSEELRQVNKVNEAKLNQVLNDTRKT